MTNKKSELKRLLLFLLFAFGIAWIPAIILNETVGYENWFNGPYVIFGLPTLYAPALANIITRKITKEGWENSLFHLNFKGHLKYYVLAVLFPFIQGLLSNITATLVYGHWDFHEMLARQSFSDYFGSILLMFAMAPLLAWNTFGEEFGWRAYMNQKMEPLLGTTGTVIIGGIIWGVWHAPLTVKGHNFGTDYWGFPWLGIVFMSVWCVVMGVFLMWLTKKSGSIFPAAIMHCCNNAGIPHLNRFFLSGFGDLEEYEQTIPQMFVCMIPYLILAAVFTYFMIRDGKKQKPVLQSDEPAEKPAPSAADLQNDERCLTE
ncbi:MAG: CPBP family intramembrane metalloprotease [Oscillospiraceae bacterium]|nr:CPBP family intramembrane metalloprotease [Oscillospiraceae bacterium]